ncbi:alpha/beta fold hydrolase [Actinophytocola sp. KF-1]
MTPVVLLHALGSSARTWDRFAAGLPRTSIALDLPGHGTAPRTGDYSISAMADHVLRAIAAHDTVDLVGHSMGGAVAMHVAMRAPGLVRRMVIEDAPPPPHEPVPLLEPPARPPEPVDFDWAVVEPVFRTVRTPDPAWWAGLAAVPADTLWLAGGPASHVDQDRIHEAAARMPSARVVEIPAGHRIHSEAAEEFAAVVVPFLAE